MTKLDHARALVEAAHAHEDDARAVYEARRTASHLRSLMACVDAVTTARAYLMTVHYEAAPSDAR